MPMGLFKWHTEEGAAAGLGMVRLQACKAESRYRLDWPVKLTLN